MVKLHTKVSGCFRSLEMAKGFCKMRGYVVFCKENGISAYDAIKAIVKGKTPEFIKAKLSS
jgi:transposase